MPSGGSRSLVTYSAYTHGLDCVNNQNWQVEVLTFCRIADYQRVIYSTLQ